jgi:hypothetical protein
MIRKGILKSFDSATYAATVQIVGSLSVWLENIPTSRAIAASDMAAGRSVAVLSLDAGNPAECIVVAVWGGAANTHIDFIDKTHLSQDFGASAARLVNHLVVPKTGVILSTVSAGKSPFSARINGNPTATSVVYDNDTNEDMFNIMFGYNGNTFWGRIVLHNTTRGNYRYITAVNKWVNTITTTSSADDWADNDDITVQSQTNTQSGYFDVDLSTKIAATDVGIDLVIAASDSEGAYDSQRVIYAHPYEPYDPGKQVPLYLTAPCQGNTMSVPIKVIDRKITLKYGTGLEVGFVQFQATGTYEYADT